MKLRFLLPVSILILMSLACQAATSLLQGEKMLPENVLFQDDFSDPSSGWDRSSSELGSTDYDGGAYHIYVSAENSDVWANPGLQFTDTQIEVDATSGEGGEDNDFGVICRYQDGDNFYFFVISGDGYYGIGKMNNGDWQLIGMDSMPPSEAIRQGQLTNRLRADCVGSTLRLYVNGTLLAEVEDTDFSSGDAGLIAGTFSSPSTDVVFDNFVVLRP